MYTKSGGRLLKWGENQLAWLTQPTMSANE